MRTREQELEAERIEAEHKPSLGGLGGYVARNITGEEVDNAIVNGAETVYVFSKAVLVGAAQGIVHGVTGIVQSIIHPIDNVIYPVSSFLYDATLISAGHLNSNNVTNFGHHDLANIDTAMHAVKNDPQLYHDAVNRMDGRINEINKAGNNFANAPWPEQVRMASMAVSSIGTNIYAPGLMINSVKAMMNIQKIGVPFNPPSFHNWIGDAPTTLAVPTYSLIDIRAMQGSKACIFVITESKQLIIAPTNYMRESKVLNHLGESTTRVSINHHDLAQGKPILSGGELLFKDGMMTDMIGKTGHYLTDGYFLKRFTEKIFKNDGYTEAAGKFKHVETFNSNFANETIKTPNNNMNPLPPTGVGVGVLNIIAEGLKNQRAEQDHKQKQEAHEKIVREEKAHQAANLHADRAAHQRVIANTRCFNLPYDSFTHRVNTYNLVWRAEQHAILEFRLRYGSCPSWVEQQIRSSVHSTAFFATSLNYGYHSGLSEFNLTLIATGLINSYNAYNFGSYMYSPWGSYGFIGGVATEVSTISDMIDSKAHALADAWYLCFPSKNLPLKEGMVEQIESELAIAFEQKTLPFFSLHFNQNGFLYPVMHPCFQNTLIGLIIGLLDYWMKGYLNGGIYDEAFLKIWDQDTKANCDETFLRSKMTDLKEYCQKNKLTLDYLSLREMESRDGVKDKRSHSAYKQPFMTSFRIIAEVEKFERQDNILIPHTTFRVESSVEMMPDYKQYVESYQKQHGTLPPEYNQTLRCYDKFAEEVKHKMPKLPFCSDYFKLLGVIVSLCYVYTTLEKMGKKPVVIPSTSENDYSFPKAMPPIPVRYYRSYDLPLSLKDMLNPLRATEEKINALNKSLATLFSTNEKMVFPEEVKQQFETVIRNKIIETLTPTVKPQEMAELNETDVANAVNKITKVMLEIANSESLRMHRKINKSIDSYHWLSKEKKQKLTQLSLQEKIEQAKKEQESYFQLKKSVWEKDAALAKTEIFVEIPKMAHVVYEDMFKKQEENIWAEAKKILGNNITAVQEEKVKTVISQQARDAIIDIFTNINTELSKAFTQYLHFTTHFSNVFLTVKELSEYQVSESYTHSFIGFTGNDLAAKTGDNFQIVGGCGMDLPVMQCMPIPHAESFTDAIAEVFTESKQEKGKFDHNGVSYTAYRLNVCDVNHKLQPVTETQMKHETSLQTLKEVYENISSVSKLTPDISKMLVDNNGTSVMHHAAAILDLQSFKQLLNQSDMALQLADHYGNLPIHKAAEAGNVESIVMMLEKFPTLLEAKNRRGITPLMMAVQHCQLEVMQLLHVKGANFNDCLPNGLFPLYMAVQKNFIKLALWMLDNVANLNVNLELDSKMTTLHLSIQGEFDSLSLKLIEKGASCDIRRKSDGYTALHCAAKLGNVELLGAMFAKNISINIELESRKTPLHIAAQEGNLDAVKLLHQKGANINAIDLDGETPLMLAIRAGKTETACFLATHAAINTVNFEMQTASLLAVHYAMPRVADILINVVRT